MAKVSHVPASTIRNNWSDYINKARYLGESFVLEVRGKPVAMLVPLPEDLAKDKVRPAATKSKPSR